MENKQGCVDWLVEEINKQKAWADPSKLEPIIQQAKAMHKEEIVDAYTECWMNDGGNGFHKVKEAESYYNETFNNENTDTTT